MEYSFSFVAVFSYVVLLFLVFFLQKDGGGECKAIIRVIEVSSIWVCIYYITMFTVKYILVMPVSSTVYK